MKSDSAELVLARSLGACFLFGTAPAALLYFGIGWVSGSAELAAFLVGLGMIPFLIGWAIGARLAWKQFVDLAAVGLATRRRLAVATAALGTVAGVLLAILMLKSPSWSELTWLGVWGLGACAVAIMTIALGLHDLYRQPQR